MQLVVTCNGPGETAGWLTPLLHSLYAQDHDARVYVFFVPDDYATGSEPQYVRTTFPQACVYDRRAYVRAALGARADGMPEGADVVLYLGGDLMHASRLHSRFGGALSVYKFARARMASHIARAFAVDAANVRDLERAGVPHDRVFRTGNLAIDGAFAQAANAADPRGPFDVMFMPGSRTNEIRHLVPFFVTAAFAMLRETPNLRIGFGISPFTAIADLSRAVERGGDPRFFARRAKVLGDDAAPFFAGDRGERIPIVREALASAEHAQLAVTIPGTKVIELAALGVPTLACVPTNAAELAVMNGPLTYLDRVPVIGAPLKRAVVLKYATRFRFFAQPNIDASQELVRELHGTLTPGRVARVALEMLADPAKLRDRSQALRALYREHVGASVRMARALLALRAPA